MTNKLCVNHFAEGGENYALHRPSYPPEFVKVLVDECAQTGHALDVGCGSGQLSVLLAEQFDRVTATDPSQSQLDHAQHHPNVTYSNEAAESIQMPDQSVDLVVAAQAAHWFDLSKFYAEVERVAKPGCILALISYGVPTLSGDIGKRFEEFYWKEIHTFWPEGREHVENGYQNLDFPFKEQKLPSISIERNWSRDDLLGYVDTWSATRKVKAAGEEAIIKRFESDLSAIWPQEEKHQITWPIRTRVTRLG